MPVVAGNVPQPPPAFQARGDLLNLLRAYLPAAGKSQVVFTSTSTGPEGMGTPVPVDVFTAAGALAYLAERTGLDDPDAARELAAELGYLPLGLARAAVVIASQRLPYREYLKRLRSFPVEEYLAPPDEDPYPHGIAQAIALPGRCRRADPMGLCRDLLDLIALLSGGRLPGTALRRRPGGNLGDRSWSMRPSAGWSAHRCWPSAVTDPR